jgi:hypothetical protein
MSDEEGLDWWKWRLVIGFSVVFATLLVVSLFDLLYLLLGSEGQATVTERYTLPSRRGADPVVIEYKFRESDGHEREGKTNLGRSGEGPGVGDEFSIQFLPRWFPAGPDGARPARSFNWIVLGLLLLSSVGAGGFAYRAIAASQPPPRKPARRR